MTTLLTRWWACVLTLVALVACAQAAPPVADAPAAPASTATGSTVELTKLAEHGEFEQVLASIKTAHEIDQHDPRVVALVQDLEVYKKHEADRTVARTAAFDKALKEMNDKAAADKLEEALISAVDAHSLTSDKAAMLADPKMQALIQKAKDTAQAAEKNGNWVEALNLYRALDLLYDDAATFRPDVKRTARHVRVLRLYAPKELQRLSAERLKRLGKEKVEPINLGSDTWEVTLRDIELPMLRETLRSAKGKHVGTPTYKGMLDGALGALLVLVNTQALEATFPNFKDQAKVNDIKQGLESIRQDLAKRDNLTPGDTIGVLDDIMALNDRTLKLPEQVMVFEMADGATDTLDDFTAVIWPEEKESFSRNTSGKFGGVGIQISQRDDRLVVVSPLENTPAQKAGIRAGDIIVTVDGEDVSAWSLDQAVRRITGPEGSQVSLGIERTGDKDVHQFKLTRAEIEIESIRGWEHKTGGGWDYFIDPELKIGYVRLSQFIPQSADDLDAAISQMEDERGLNGLILDLRFNPGGLLSSAVDVSDRFITSGPIVSTVDHAGTKTSEFKARADHTHRTLPLVVLVNEGSASASEIVSGALQDYHRALIVGTRSFGKGSVQDLFPIDGGKAYLKLTTQHYKLPLGRIIHREPQSKTWGIQPDLVVDMTTQQVADSILFRQDVDVLHAADDKVDPNNPRPKAADILTKAMDPQLESALLVLKTELVAKDIALAQGDAPARNP